MQILNKIALKRTVSKSLINDAGNIALVLFDNSSEFAIINIIDDKLVLSYYQNLEFTILDACFSVENNIWFALNGSKNIEWNLNSKTIVRTCGEIIQNELAPHLSGYSSIQIIASQNLLIAANAGSFRLEFYQLDSLSKLSKIDALCEVYAKNIIIHPNEKIIAVQITDSEDTGNIRFYEIKDGSVELYKKYIATFFSPSACNFSADGKEFIITGGYPPFSYQLNKFPSLDFTNEFTDDGGLNIATPWGNTRGITFNNDFLVSETKIIVPYYDGCIKYIERETGKITEQVECCNSLCNSLTRSKNGRLLLCSSREGEIVLLRNEDLQFETNATETPIINLNTTDNLLLPLVEMEDIASTLDEPLQIT